MDNRSYQNADPVTDYYSQTKKNNIKDLTKKIVLLVIALVHRLIGFPYLSELLKEVLVKNNISNDLIEIITIIYLVISELFVIISIWRIIRYIKIVNIIYVLLALVYVGFFGYSYLKTTDIYNRIVNKPLTSFVIETREIGNNARTYWEKETITTGSRRITYIKSNGDYCNDKKLAITDDNVNYMITIDINGNIVEYKITNGRFQYNYHGNGLLVDNITADKFVKIDGYNRIEIPSCNY